MAGNDAWPRVRASVQDDRFYFYLSDTTWFLLTTTLLTGADNYQLWIQAVSDALLVKNKLCFVDGTYPRYFVTKPVHLTWDRCNVVVKAWIVNSIAKDFVYGMHYNQTTHSVWDDMKERFNMVDDTHIYHLECEMYQTKECTLSIARYFGKIRILWVELAIVDDD